jgi:hypothetical protein
LSPDYRKQVDEPGKRWFSRRLLGVVEGTSHGSFLGTGQARVALSDEPPSVGDPTTITASPVTWMSPIRSEFGAHYHNHAVSRG